MCGGGGVAVREGIPEGAALSLLLKKDELGVIAEFRRDGPLTLPLSFLFTEVALLTLPLVLLQPQWFDP